MALPPGLLRYLADSELRVLRWDAAAGELSVEVKKDVGGEQGLLTFHGVSHVNLPPALGIESIVEGELPDLPPGYLATYRPDDAALGADEHAYLVLGSWGERHFVVARSVTYGIR